MAIDTERLKKLLLVVLSSDQAGEVMAASAAIAKLLKKDAKDIHWLVASVTGQKQTKPASSPPGNMSDWSMKLAYCEEQYDYLTPRQQEFIGSLCLQRNGRGSRWQPSVAQKTWLSDIYSKKGGR